MKMNQRTLFVLAKYCKRRYLVILVDMYLSVDETLISVRLHYGTKKCFVYISAFLKDLLYAGNQWEIVAI